MDENKIGLIKGHLRKKLYSRELEHQRHTFITMLYEKPGFIHEIISLMDIGDTEEMFFAMLDQAGKFLPSAEEGKNKEMKIIGAPYQKLEYYTMGKWYLFNYLLFKYTLRDTLFYYQSDGSEPLGFHFHDRMIQQQVDNLLLDPKVLLIYCYQEGSYYRMLFHWLENADGTMDAALQHAQPVDKAQVEEALGMKIQVPA